MSRLLNDEPTLFDELGRVDLVQRISNAVATSSPPQVFGLHGDWGMGKTSALHQIHWDLVGECPQQDLGKHTSVPGLGDGGRFKDSVTVVWFEAWRYQNEKAPIVALLQEIRTQLPWYSRALRQSQKLADVTIRGALLSLEDLTKRIGFQASKFEEAGWRWDEENLATRLPSHMIRQHLEEALRTLLRGRGRKEQRLVVLVDDLDRCESETAYQLLEGIKIYLNLPSCVFVLGMNQDIIEEAVARHLPEKADEGARRRTAKRYLEKLCQNIWHLPLVRDPAGLLKRYLERHPFADELTDIVSAYDCLPPVPRKIKGYANLLARFEAHLGEVREQYAAPRGNAAEDGLREQIATDAPPRDGPPRAKRPEDEGTKERSNRWAMLAVAYTYLYHFHHQIYRLLWGNGQEFWDQLRYWCSGEENRLKAQLEHLGHREKKPDRESKAVDRSEKQATPASGPELETVFHDPAADDVLHVEALIRAIGPIEEDEARRHLLR